MLQRSKAFEAGDMAIGEFGGAPAAAVDNGPTYAAPAYWLYELSHAALNPARALADSVRDRSAVRPVMTQTWGSASSSAAASEIQTLAMFTTAATARSGSGAAAP